MAGSGEQYNPDLYFDWLIEESLAQLDGVTLTPQEAKLLLSFRLHQHREIVEDDLEPQQEGLATDEMFALAEIANGYNETSFGEVYRRYRGSASNVEPILVVLAEGVMTRELVEGTIWDDAAQWRQTSGQGSDII